MTTLFTPFPDWPQRSETIEWRVYDIDGFDLGRLMVSTDETPTISNDTTRSIRRSVSTLNVLPRPMIDIDPNHYYADDVLSLQMRVSPWWTFGDGTRVQGGMFVFGDDSEVLWSGGSPRPMTLTDLCASLDQPLSRSYGYGAGTSVNDAIADLLGTGAAGEVGTEDMGGIESTDAVIGTAVGFAAGRDTTLTALDALCKIAGFLPPYFDYQGQLVCRDAPDLASATAAFEYGAGLGGVVPGSAVKSNDRLTAPNRYVVVGGNSDAELVGIFNVPDSAPNSFVKTGRLVVKTDNIQGIATQAQADAAAAAMYATDISSYTWLSFQTVRVNPYHDTWDIVSFDGVNYREVGWTYEAKSGGTMTHTLRGADL